MHFSFGRRVSSRCHYFIHIRHWQRATTYNGQPVSVERSRTQKLSMKWKRERERKKKEVWKCYWNWVPIYWIYVSKTAFVISVNKYEEMYGNNKIYLNCRTNERVSSSVVESTVWQNYKTKDNDWIKFCAMKKC